MSTVRTTIRTTIPIERDGVEVMAECVFDHHPACRGARDSLGGKAGAGPPLEPDDPESLEFKIALSGGVNPVELTDDEIERAEQQCWDERSDERDYDED